MKYIKILTLLICSSVLFFYGCNEKSKTPEQKTEKSVKVSETSKATTPPKTKEPAQNASGIWHYTCRMGCSGGAGSAVKCATCGIALAHNTAYHAKANSTTDNSPFATPASNKPTKTPEPAQNAAGVWHYTCANGHPGGAGSAVACSTCSTTLTHNQGYH